MPAGNVTAGTPSFGSLGISPSLNTSAGPSSANSYFGGATISFTDGSFTAAHSPSPGTTAALANTSGAVAAIGSGLSNALTGLTSATSGLLPLVAGGVLVWLLISHLKRH